MSSLARSVDAGKWCGTWRGKYPRRESGLAAPRAARQLLRGVTVAAEHVDRTREHVGRIPVPVVLRLYSHHYRARSR